MRRRYTPKSSLQKFKLRHYPIVAVIDALLSEERALIEKVASAPQDAVGTIGRTYTNVDLCQ